jgi:CheY-like chemotaxis protein
MKDALQVQRVLLVDDNLHGLTARKLILAEQGFQVEIARSGEEAWEMFRRKPFDVVVTDYRMAGMNGVELIGLIRQSDSPARTILLSAFVECLGMTERSTGADQIISKSGREVQDLLRAIRKFTANAPRRRGPRAETGPQTAAPHVKPTGAGSRR